LPAEQQRPIVHPTGAITLDRVTRLDAPITDSESRASWLPLGLISLVAIGIAGYGIAAAGKDTVRAADVVRMILVVAWAVAGALALRRPAIRHLGALVVIGSGLGAIAFAGARVGDVDRASVATTARFIATITCPLLMAVSAHALLSLPGGRLQSRMGRTAVWCGYAVALVAGLVLWQTAGHVSVGIGAIGWTLAVAAALPSAHRNYLLSAGANRQRLQMMGCGAAIAGEIALVATALHLFLDWPASVGAIAAAATVLLPLALAASTS
jgi:hypothetical protein